MIKDGANNKNIYLFCIVNSITLGRVPLIILFINYLTQYLSVKESVYCLGSIVMSILIIISDFLDGRLARKYNVTSKIGQVLDIYLDCAYIFAGLITLYVYNYIDLYFIIVVLYKFLEFIILSKVMKSKIKFKGNKGQDYFYDLLGTIASGFYYVIPLIVISLSYLDLIYFTSIINFLLAFATILTVFSSLMKFKKIYKLTTYGESRECKENTEAS